MEGVRAGIGRVGKQVREGTLALQAGAATPRGKPPRPARRPYSLLLAEPFVKVRRDLCCSGAGGCQGMRRLQA